MKIHSKLYILLIYIITLNCSPEAEAIGNNKKESTENSPRFIVSTDIETFLNDGTKIIKVVNLNTSGVGSLKSALETPGKRIIIFEIGGVLDLNMTTLEINDPFVTIAGQTAPSPGITLIKGGILIKTHHVKISHISIRPGDANQPKQSGWEPDGISTYGEHAHDIVIDHCSLTWAVDENLSASGPRNLGPEFTSRNIVFSNNIIAEALNNATHSKGMHSMGSLVHDLCQNITFVNNLFANNTNRNPYVKASTTVSFINNILFNAVNQPLFMGYPSSEWVGSSIRPTNPTVSCIGNILFAGKHTRNGMALIEGVGNAYLEDNLAFNAEGGLVPSKDSKVIVLEVKPDWTYPYTPIPSNQLEAYIIKNVGSRPKDRDYIDKRIIENFINRASRILDSQNQEEGYPQHRSTYKKLKFPKENFNQWLNEITQSVE